MTNLIYPMSVKNRPHALYIHIPFCVKKCIYCDFNSVRIQSELVDDYLGAIECELRSLYNGFSFTTIYIGGGTPTVLLESQLERLLDIVSKYIKKSTLAEYTIEANPGTLNDRKILILKSSDINRISIGVQTFHDTYLRLLGRIHTADKAKDMFLCLRENGFENINIDLIYGYPKQTLPEWKSDIKKSMSLGADHISAYCLTYEEGTPLFGLLESEIMSRLSQEEELMMYEYAEDFLGRNGFLHYEISNFAKKDKKCLHNIVYWRNMEYVGIGAGSFSYLNGARFSNIRDVKDYVSAIASGRCAVNFSEKLSQQKRASEILIMALRMTCGISRKDFIDRSGFDFMELFGQKIDEMVKAGLLILDDKTIRLTKKGFTVADSVMMEFV